ncbi:uncharacterized protein LOC130119799 [Lampris incognitus]|uniref:uncharacterized protein LOC130119799 n=1 Tax=Lampris incognitus TaxID=2546036 RepID=UPI0024B5C61D|nr:uncharacterized protein LOC130119799 [Lampris incognitus]
MVLADTLSRLPNPENHGDIELDEHINGIDAEIEDPELHTITIINFSEKQDALHTETAEDPKLSVLKELIHQGWPEKIQDLPKDLHAYSSFRDTLAVESGVIVKGRQVLIPDSMTEAILKQLHGGHQGIEKTRRLAQERVYWTKMNDDIERMEEEGRTVRVSGLPTDIEDDRLTDKLYVHFLRAKHGGGEIVSVTIVEALQGTALITFEDRQVAQRVVEHGQHILLVDGKKHELTLTKPCQNLDPNKVILSMLVTVDYSQIPLGQTTVTRLHKGHPDIHIDYNTPEELCTLRGPYSHVQAALAELLGLLGGPGFTQHINTGYPSFSDSKVFHRDQTSYSMKSHGEGQGRRPNEQREHIEQVHRTPGAYRSSPRGEPTSGGHGWDDTGHVAAGAVQLLRYSTMAEDFSLIMDADLFHYLQKHCGEEYQHILSQYGVNVIDVTAQGLTTLFLQSTTGVGQAGRELEHLRMASGELSRLYQEHEKKICRAQLSKNILHPRGGLETAMENLSVRLSKILLAEDDQNIYITGSSSDVCEAKCYLLDQSKGNGVREDVASLLRYPSYDLGSSKPDEEARLMRGLPSQSLHSTVDGRKDNLLSSDEDERRAEGASRYKLAARFKDSGLGGLGNRPGNFTTAKVVKSPMTQTGLGSILGPDGLSETEGFIHGEHSRAAVQNTGGDILFKSGDQNKPYLSSTSAYTGQKFTIPPLNTAQSSQLASSTHPSTCSGSNLRRTSSFSERPQPKTQANRHSEDQEDTGKNRTRGRSSSCSNQTRRDKKDVLSAEITISKVMWEYIKEVYGYRLQDLTTGLQLKENHSRSSYDLTVIFLGADSSRVSLCQLGLQKLISMVTTDFSMQELCLSELGVADSADETLEACLAEVRSRFRKVSILTLQQKLYLLGPKELCAQVAAALREVFCRPPAQASRQHDISISSTNIFNESVAAQTNEGQNSTLHCNNSDAQQKSDHQRRREGGSGSGQDRKSAQESDSTERQRNCEIERFSGSVSQPLVRKDPVIKEQAKSAGIMQADGQKTDDRSVTTVSSIGSPAGSAGQDMVTIQKETFIHSKATQREPENQQKPEEYPTHSSMGRSSLGDQGNSCVWFV